jgi:hypothetical protein
LKTKYLMHLTYLYASIYFTPVLRNYIIIFDVYIKKCYFKEYTYLTEKHTAHN